MNKNLEVCVGIFDDPENQEQSIFSLNLMESGHIAICGRSASGKSTFFQTFLFSLLKESTAEEVCLYLLDFNGSGMDIYDLMPQVKQVIKEEEEDKVEELFENIKKEYTKEERKRIILGELILNKTPLKSYYFTSNLKISEGILNNDLYELENWLNQFNIKIIKKQGVGIYLEGSEENYRKVLSNILYSAIGQNKIIDLLGNNNEIDKNLKDLTLENKLLDFVEEDLIKTIQNVLNNIEKKYEFKLHRTNNTFNFSNKEIAKWRYNNYG